jgi:hypothetical protein
MNVDEFSPGKGIKLWMFFITSVCLIAIVLIIWGVVSGKLSEIWRKRLSRRQQNDDSSSLGG